MPDYSEYFGYTPQPELTAAYKSALPFKSLAGDLPHLIAQIQQKDTALWPPLLSVKPSWKRGAQAIGDCVSWGAELACTMLLAMQHVSGDSEWVEEVATETVYGLRCNLSSQFCNRSDGWWGSGPAEALQKWGVILRLNYSEEVGEGYDLRSYSGDRAKKLGAEGLSDKALGLARQFPCKGVVPIKNAMEAAAVIESGSTVTVASSVGYGGMARNSEGIVRRSGSWAHQMMFGGVRWKNGEPQLRLFQSWGKSASGPDPGIDQQVISDCSWWVVAEDADRMFREDDSYAFARVEGFAQKAWDWNENFFV